MVRGVPQSWRLRLLGGTLLLIAAGCGTGHAASPPAPTTAAQPARATETQQPAPPVHVAPEGGLQRLRKIEDKFSNVDPKLEEGVRAVSALESDVRCWTPAKWATLERTLGVSANSFFGVTDPFTYDIHLHGYVCDWIHLLIAGEPLPNEDDRLEAATWLVLLTHEAEHLTSAGSNERLAECRAVQDADKVGAALGIDEAYAQELSKLYWEKVYPTETDGYRSPECRNGGSMDQNPDISAWP